MNCLPQQIRLEEMPWYLLQREFGACLNELPCVSIIHGHEAAVQPAVQENPILYPVGISLHQDRSGHPLRICDWNMEPEIGVPPYAYLFGRQTQIKRAGGITAPGKRDLCLRGAVFLGTEETLRDVAKLTIFRCLVLQPLQVSWPT